MSRPLSLLSAGAAESFVRSLQPEFDRLDRTVDITFGAVGALKDAYLAGAACDLLITSAAGLDDLRGSGHLEVEEAGDVGWVETGLAVRAGDPIPDVSTPEALERALRAAPALYVPDARRSTAGGHFAKVLGDVGIGQDSAQALHEYPNGATAMRALADAAEVPGAIGGTQVTEIKQTPGVALAGPLSGRHRLTTLYRCALVRGEDPAGEVHRRVFELLTGPGTASCRQELGFSQEG